MKHLFTALVAALTLAFTAPAFVSNALAADETPAVTPAQPADAMDEAMTKEKPAATTTTTTHAMKKKSATHHTAAHAKTAKGKTAHKGAHHAKVKPHAEKMKDSSADTGATAQ